MPDATLVEDLKREIARGQCVIIAGTGVSVAASENPEMNGCRIATWPGLIKHGIAWCQSQGYCDAEDADILARLANSGKTANLISAAERVTEILKSRSSGIYRRWLRDTVGSLKAQRPEIVSALAALPAILATLNYDSLIEQATRRQAVTWMDEDKVQDILRGERADAVLHLHGYYDAPDSVVLGLASYIAVKNSAHTRAVLESFTIGRTLVFVGCAGTLEDPNFTRLIEWGRETLRNTPYRHFVLCRDAEVGVIRTLSGNAPWLFAVAYGVDHADLLPFLQSLAPGPDASVRAVRSVGAATSDGAAASASATAPQFTDRAASDASITSPAPAAVQAVLETVLSAVQGAELSIDQRFALVNAIAALPDMADVSRRNAIVSLLGNPIANSVPYDSQARAHILNMVGTCLDYSGGIARLYSALAHYYEGAGKMKGVDDTLVRISHEVEG